MKIILFDKILERKDANNLFDDYFFSEMPGTDYYILTPRGKSDSSARFDKRREG